MRFGGDGGNWRAEFCWRKQGFHRRDALWQIERVARRPGPLLEAVEPDDALAQHLRCSR